MNVKEMLCLYNFYVRKFCQTRLKFAVGRDCMQNHFSKYEIEKNAFLGLGSVI